jgi:hypothetical protein
MMDIWMISCMAFVFAAMGEFLIVKRMYDLSHPDELGSPENPILGMGRSFGPFKGFRPENDFIMTKNGVCNI